MSRNKSDSPSIIRRAGTWLGLFSCCFIFGFLILAPSIRAIGRWTGKDKDNQIPAVTKGNAVKAANPTAPSTGKPTLTTPPSTSRVDKNEPVSIELDNSTPSGPANDSTKRTDSVETTPSRGIDSDGAQRPSDEAGAATTSTPAEDSSVPRPNGRRRGRRTAPRSTDGTDSDGSTGSTRRRDDGVTKHHTVDN